MKNKLIQYCKKEALFYKGASVLCAVSGGPDSVALLRLLYEARNELGIKNIGCVHFNHRLRGVDSDRDEIFVKNLAGKMDVPYYSGSADVAKLAKEKGQSLEEAAREARYEFFKTISGYDFLATAHTAEDQLETVLQHMIRGTGLHGLTGIPPQRDQIVRPLLVFSKTEIIDYLNGKGQDYCLDRTNESDDYQRNRIRHHLIPFLKKENPSILSELEEHLSVLREDDQFLEEQAEKALVGQFQREENSIVCKRDFLKSLSKAIRNRVYQILVRNLTEKVPYTRQLAMIDQILFNDRPSAEIILRDIRVRCQYESIYFESVQEEKTPEAIEIAIGETAVFGDWEIQTRILDKEESFSQKIETFYIDYDIMTHPFLVRSRKPGDRISLLKGRGSRLISDLMIDRKIPREIRNQIPVLLCDGRIVAVGGFGMDSQWEPRPGHTIIQVSMKKRTTKGRRS